MKNLCNTIPIFLSLMFLFLLGKPVLSSEMDIDQIKEMIDIKGYEWRADENVISVIPWADFQQSLTYFEPFPGDWPDPIPNIEKMSFPERFDWREHNGCTEARNQGVSSSCYPCWAYALIGAAESAFKIYSGKDLDLSEQQLIDCNTNGYGCHGGFIEGWTAMRDYGAVLESCYPYIASDCSCRQLDCMPAGWIAGAYKVPYTEKSLKYALLNHSALSCSMTVYNDFMFYSDGCYEHEDTKPINHGVVIVGWDDNMCSGEGAWMVRNSWGTGWGDEGIAYMKYETCNIGKHAQWMEYSNTPPPYPFNYSLFMPDQWMQAGDWFVLEHRFGNPTDEHLEFMEFLFLDIYGEYWFYPEFKQSVEWTDFELDPKEYRFDVIISFQWPDNVHALTGIFFWGACIDPIDYDVLHWDGVEWGAE